MCARSATPSLPLRVHHHQQRDRERAICPYFRVVRTNGSGSYFDALRVVRAMSYADRVRKRNFAHVLCAILRAILEGSTNEVDSDRLNLLAQLLSI